MAAPIYGGNKFIGALGNWIEGADFFQRGGTLWYGVGQSSHTLLIQIYPDTIPEITEEYTERVYCICIQDIKYLYMTHLVQ